MDWIWETIKEKDLKKFQNGAAQPAELERTQVRACHQQECDVLVQCAFPLIMKSFSFFQVQETPKRPLSQSLSAIFSPLFNEVTSSPSHPLEGNNELSPLQTHIVRDRS